MIQESCTKSDPSGPSKPGKWLDFAVTQEPMRIVTGKDLIYSTLFRKNSECQEDGTWGDAGEEVGGEPLPLPGRRQGATTRAVAQGRAALRNTQH